ncbi:MAG TPA: restriction endonuclease subunit R [Cryomorphaceae bacterium]|jgi:predicted type IV restriction endonuclease|nr:MAG: hypothetical protein ABR98_02205 [Cryomorphaceae bacterium BACL7 MAG-120910-bin2]KRO82981.1 MAG: hypothetical protein ABR87_04180 [Cryomorphaceae bacterium BACL7 MAG-121220-bin83]NQW25365.1 type I restriction enzyme HsdR N-terminal domain-containing protein [Cryomorphaceae bacterium]HAB31060.1 restriction endonuclease subunit R [Cryomorphaceae bacterium]HAG48528.1 restriction endonuclease subunit R [Cryomorphaceae bacterium]
MTLRPWLHESMQDLDPECPTLWDAFRKKHVKASPEEWVRQDALRRLMLDAGYPAAAIAIEKGFLVNGLLKRFDIAVYVQGELWMLIECKAPSIRLNEQVSDQWMRYNLVTKATWGVLTNGETWKIFCADGAQGVPKLPAFGTFAL